MTNFRVLVSIIFGTFLFIGVIMLALSSNSSEDARGEIVIWGTIPTRAISPILQNIKTNTLTLTYEEKRSDDFADVLIEAFASGKGPDVFLLPHNLAVRFSDKTLSVSEEMISPRVFQDIYIEEGDMFTYAGDIIALPLFVDPMVLYWNRDIFGDKGIPTPPEYWVDVLADTMTLTIYDQAGNIVRPAISLGEFSNVDHAKDILAMLLLQTGSGIVSEGSDGAALSFIGTALESVLRFYTEFARPGKDNYTWNRSFDEARDMFVAGESAMYLGYASELSEIVAENPHLNFDITEVPQLREGGVVSTYGDLTGVAVSRTTSNIVAARYVQLRLQEGEHMASLAAALQVAPARRELLAEPQTDVYKDVYYKSAIISRGWLDPQPKISYTIFEDAVDNITSGRVQLSDASYSVFRSLQELIRDTGIGKGY